MNKTFYQFLMTFRGHLKPNNYNKLADAVFSDSDFPKHETDYEELSNYIEMRGYFLEATAIFDELWQEYKGM